MYRILVACNGFSPVHDAALREILSKQPDITVLDDTSALVPDVRLTPDALTWPAQLASLLSYIHANALPDGAVTCGSITLDPYTHMARVGGHTVELTDIESGLLLRLLRAGGAPVPRDTLLAGVWGFRSDLETHTLETHIYRLRQKLETDPANPHHVLTADEAYRVALP